jgi:Secretion system C-terminal sorting domain
MIVLFFGLRAMALSSKRKDVLNIKGLDAQMSYELSVMSVKGEVVAHDRNASSGLSGSIHWNLQSLSKGVYYLRITSTNNKKTTVKFEKY